MDCEICNKGTLELIPEVFPWHDDYYICSTCESTFTVDYINGSRPAGRGACLENK